MQPLFHGAREAGTPWPRSYADFPDGPLPEHSVRLLVLPLEDSPALAAAGSAVTRDVLAVLPKTTKVRL